MRETRSHLHSRTRGRVDSEALLNDHVQIPHVLDSIIQRTILCYKGMHMEVGIEYLHGQLNSKLESLTEFT